MKTTFLFGVGLLVATAAMAGEEPRPLFDFTGTDAAKNWRTVNDGVMGGVSEGRFQITDRGTMEFYGKLSLECNRRLENVAVSGDRSGGRKT